MCLAIAPDGGGDEGGGVGDVDGGWQLQMAPAQRIVDTSFKSLAYL